MSLSPDAARYRLTSRSFAALAAGLVGLTVAACGSSDGGGAGTLDTSFGDKGTVTHSLGDGDDTAAGMLVGADGTIVVVGSTTSSDGAATSANMLVERYTANGSLDATFGTGNDDGSPDGTVTLSLGDGSDEGRAIAAQPDGKLVVAGTSTSTDSSSNIVVARLDTAGVPDASFGAGNDDGTPDGFVQVSLSDGDDTAHAITVQPDGKILIAGTTSSADGNNIAVARMNDDGSLDSSFGVGSDDGSPDGVVTLSLGDGNDEARSIIVQPDGKILVAGTGTSTATDGSSNIIVARMAADGSLDGTFGTADDGTPNGVVNISLGDGNDVADAIALQPDGKILVAGTHAASTGTNGAIARLAADGSLDASFGSNADDGTPEGVVSLSLGEGDDSIVAIAVQPDGKIVVVGTTSSTGDTSNAFVIRLLTDGTADEDFGTADDGTPNGVVNISFSDGDDAGDAVALQSDGKIVVVGSAVSGGTSDIALARLLVG